MNKAFEAPLVVACAIFVVLIDYALARGQLTVSDLSARARTIRYLELGGLHALLLVLVVGWLISPS